MVVAAAELTVLAAAVLTVPSTAAELTVSATAGLGTRTDKWLSTSAISRAYVSSFSRVIYPVRLFIRLPGH